MELILLQNVEKVGRKGDVVKVHDGFARNFLLPQKLALSSTRSNRQFVEEQRARSEVRHQKEKAGAQTQAEQLSQLKLILEAQAGEKGKLYGSVTADDIQQALSQKGFSVDKKQIHLKESIRSLGEHAVQVELHPQVKATVTIEVIQKS